MPSSSSKPPRRKSKEHTNLSIENFGDRIKWAYENLRPDPQLLKFAFTPQHVRAAALKLLDEADERDGSVRVPYARSRKAWDRLMKGSVPPVYIELVLRLFPELPRSMLVTPRYADFIAKGAPIQQARRRWTDAIEYLATHRHHLADLGKRYHRTADHAQTESFPYKNFPLIAGKGWILNKPLRLQEEADVKKLPPLLHFDKSFVKSPALEGLNIDYRTLKSHLVLEKRWRRRPDPPFDGNAFCLIDLSADGDRLDFGFGPCGYFDYVNSCEILGVELADWCIRHPGMSPHSGALPLRGQPGTIFEFHKRAAFVGVNCLTILKNWYSGGGYSDHRHLRKDWFLVHLRDETTLEAQNTVHVFPAGGHQPLLAGSGDRTETQVWNTVVREFIEELFDKEYLADAKNEPGRFFDHPEVKPLVDVFFRGTHGKPPCARIFLLGIGLDPVTAKPEILVAIVVDWEQAKRNGLAQDITPNWEAREGQEQREHRVRWIELSKQALHAEAGGYCQRLNGSDLPTLPAGAACMMIAARHLALLLGSDE